MNCHDCGAELGAGATTCKDCGAEQPVEDGGASRGPDRRVDGGGDSIGGDDGSEDARADDGGESSRADDGGGSTPAEGQQRGRGASEDPRWTDEGPLDRRTGTSIGSGGGTGRYRSEGAGRGSEASWADAEVLVKDVGLLFQEGTIVDDRLGYGTAFLLADRLVFAPEDRGTLRTWFVLSISECTLPEAARNPDTYEIPLSSITAVQLETVGMWGAQRHIVIESTEMGRVQLKFGSDNENLGEDVDRHEEFARRLREQAIAQGADVSREESFEQPLPLWQVSMITGIGVFALVLGLVAILVSRPFMGAIMLLLGVATLFWSFLKGAKHLGS